MSEQREAVLNGKLHGKSHLEPAERLSAAVAARRPVFLSNRRLDLIKLRAALAAGDFRTIASIGHNCKGTGVGYGFPEITSLGSSLEAAARAQDTIRVEASIAQFARCILDCSEQLVH